MIDLRRFLPRGAVVTGPFLAGYPIGTLRTTPNSASDLSSRLASIISSRAPLAAVVGDLAGLARSRFRVRYGRRTEPGVTRADLGLSILHANIPESAWTRGERSVVALLSHDTQPWGPYMQVCDTGDSVVISLWDETSTIDPDIFRSTIRSTMAAAVNS